jgi:hypothetical protein
MNHRALRAACACLVLASTGLARAEAMGGVDYPDGAAATAASVEAITSMSNSVDASPVFALAALVLLVLGRTPASRSKN